MREKSIADYLIEDLLKNLLPNGRLFDISELNQLKEIEALERIGDRESLKKAVKIFKSDYVSLKDWSEKTIVF